MYILVSVDCFIGWQIFYYSYGFDDQNTVLMNGRIYQRSVIGIPYFVHKAPFLRFSLMFPSTEMLYNIIDSQIV